MTFAPCTPDGSLFSRIGVVSACEFWIGMGSFPCGASTSASRRIRPSLNEGSTLPPPNSGSTGHSICDNFANHYELEIPHRTSDQLPVNCPWARMFTARRNNAAFSVRGVTE